MELRPESIWLSSPPRAGQYGCVGSGQSGRAGTGMGMEEANTSWLPCIYKSIPI